MELVFEPETVAQFFEFEFGVLGHLLLDAPDLIVHKGFEWRLREEFPAAARQERRGHVAESAEIVQGGVPEYVVFKGGEDLSVNVFLPRPLEEFRVETL